MQSFRSLFLTHLVLECMRLTACSKSEMKQAVLSKILANTAEESQKQSEPQEEEPVGEGAEEEPVEEGAEGGEEEAPKSVDPPVPVK